jgi:carotenoid cleavage dioxygenase-like enzyme
MSENPYLSGNFAPVEDELSAVDLPVTGSVPRELEGRLLRIGPNPVTPPPPTHHWFLGNGMVHGVRLRGGRAEWYRRRYVRDDEVASAKGWPAVPGPRPEFLLAGGIANTHVMAHAGRIFALVEGGNPPVELDPELETIARSDFGGTLPGGFSAHPKRDPDTGEWHAAAYSPLAESLQYLVVGRDGKVRRSVDIPRPGKPMVHDCAITGRYFVVFDLPVTFDPKNLEDGSPLPYRWNPDYGARVGLLPREGSADDVKWCEVEPCYVFHAMNAWDAPDGRVVLDVVRHPRMFASDLRGPNEGAPTLERWTLDPASGETKEERLDEVGQEFPRLDERRTGKPYRFGYTAGFGAELAFGGLRQRDLRDGGCSIHHEGPARHFLEPVFVPRTPDADEDDGWVLASVYDASTDKSDVVILHAQDFAGAPVATIHLPVRVPFGFHGSWVPDPV